MHIGRTIVVALLYGLGAAAIAVAVSIDLDVWRYDALSSGLTPLRFRLADVDGAEQHSSPFTTAWSASHEVSLVFPTPVDSPSLRQAVESASASVGANAPYPSFDFEWQVLEGNEHVARGSGRNRPVSVSSVPGTVTLGFGKFEAEAGHAYVLRTSFGRESDSYRSARMEIQVAVAEPAQSIGLAWVHDVGSLATWVFALAGAALLTLAGALTLRGYRRAV